MKERVESTFQPSTPWLSWNLNVALETLCLCICPTTSACSTSRIFICVSENVQIVREFIMLTVGTVAGEIKPNIDVWIRWWTTGAHTKRVMAFGLAVRII